MAQSPRKRREGLRPRASGSSTRASRPDVKRRAKKKAAEKKSVPRWRRWAKRIALALLVCGLIGVLGLAGIFWYYGRDLPDVSALRDYAPPQTSRVVDRNGELIGEIFSERRTVIELSEIPPEFVRCTLAAEDADFYRHEGLDYPGIVRALIRDVLEGRAAQGASTITQQVVKLLLLSPERTLARKVRELILARRLEQELTKDEILHLYLNHINYGHGRYGVQEAAQFYFGKDASELSLAESSLIAGVPQAPARLSPRSHPEAARRRQRYVLAQLEAKREEYWPEIGAEDIQAAREATPTLIERESGASEGAELMRLARRTLRERVNDEARARGGFTIHTTIDLELQRKAHQALREGLETLDERQRNRGPLWVPRRPRNIRAVDELREGRVYRAQVTAADDEEGTIVFDVGGHRTIVDASSAERYNPEGLPPSELAPIGAQVDVSITRLGDEDQPAVGRLERGPQGAVVVIDPRTRDVLAMVGGYDVGPGFNRAVQAQRQPGSTFKPIVYAQAIRTRTATPASVMIDAPAVYDRWKPQNYETWSHQGAVRLRVALARSINLVAIRSIEEVGPESVVDFARQLGIESELEPTLALALGASAVRPIEMVNAYATFAAGGRWEAPRWISRIEGPDGDVDLERRPEARDVLTPAEAYVITNMMTSVTAEGGTGGRAAQLGRPTAGKTGTSNEARDAWFVGFTPNVVAGVWVGYDHRRSLGRREGGGRSALPIWIEVIRAATEGRPVVQFPRPSGVEEALIDPVSGLLAYEGQQDAITEVFLEGTVPTETARPPDVADPSTFLMEQLGGTDTEEDPDAGIAP